MSLSSLALRLLLRSSIAVALAFSLTSCGNSEPDQKDQSAQADAAVAPSPKAQGGYATGRVLGPGNQPLKLPGAQAKIFIYGVSSAGERVQYSPAPKADGVWRTRLADGVYHKPTAQLQIAYGGKSYRYELVPLNGPEGDTDSADGLYCDFVWRPTGPTPLYASDPNPSTHTHWFGGSIGIQYLTYREDLKRAVRAPVEGARLMFELRPKGPLIDGSTVDVIRRELVVDRLGWLVPDDLHDIPCGKYVLTGSIVEPGGQPVPLEFAISFAVFGDALEIAFEPGSVTALNPILAGVAPKGW